MTNIKTIIIGLLLIFSVQYLSAADGQYDFGVISHDTTLVWGAQLPIYTPSVSLYFKTTKRMYVSLELNGTINSVQDMSQGLNIHPDLVTIHSHPSGNIIQNLQPAPSAQDVTNGLDNGNSYVIDMSNKIVFIYNKTGILSSFPLKIYTK